ncbi:cytidine deaminase [Streptomyces werraensis]|uniref:Cytidine deaminase n=1 Tax=Streptomyces werraensis TaxID=68284 RepID=A0ABV3JA27_9ACTN
MPTHHVDEELVAAATEIARTRCRGDHHTMAAAARAADGRIVTGVNVYHFTGGPCAELVVVGAAAAQGAYDLETIVAVGDRDRGVVPPCGRCRQTLLDHFPTLEVVVPSPTGLRAVPVADLLPHTYVWADHQLETPSNGGPT